MCESSKEDESQGKIEKAYLEIQWKIRCAKSEEEYVAEAENLLQIMFADLAIYVHAKCHPFTAEADDVVQETLIKVVKKYRSFRGFGYRQFRGWYRQIAARLIADTFRKKKQDRWDTYDPEIHEQMFAKTSDGEPISASERMDLETISKWLEVSKPQCRELLWKFFIEDDDYHSLARHYQVNYKALVERVSRCLKHAKRLVIKKEQAP